MTANHVVEAASAIRIVFPDGASSAGSVFVSSRSNDLALVRVPRETPAYLQLAEPRAVAVGQEVFTIGYPASQILGREPKFTDGSISALSGPGGEASLLQTSVPIQPGNSGGPLVDEAGRVVGIVTATAAILPFLKATGALPQNVNWAVKAEYARLLFDVPAPRGHAITREAAIEGARAALCRVEAVQ
jgi:S1-C subfamily serine protease